MDYKVGAYVRLSREDETKTSNFSESINNQKEYILKYISYNNMNLIDIYVDDGFSGTNFDRPGFKSLIQDIELGKINMVITKDLSRLGRDHIETGNLLEKYFPTHNIRYVAINDNYDSLEDDSSANDIAPFKNVFNDMYAKDISKKVRTALHTKQLNGEFVGTNAPIGYIKDNENKHKLVIDKNTSYIVKRIYREFLEGNGINTICKNLIKDNIPSPEYLNSNGKRNYLWNSTTIRRILKNEVYIGDTVGHKVKKINYKIKKQVMLPKDNWIKVENTHEPIISKEDFEKVQNILNKRSYIPKSR